MRVKHGVAMIICLMAAVFAVGSLAATLPSFRSATKWLESNVYNTKDARKTFYHGCAYNSAGRVDIASCGYEADDVVLARTMAWSYVIPPDIFARNMACWSDPQGTCGHSNQLKCCRSVPEFVSIEANLHNIVPMIGEFSGQKQYLQGFGDVRDAEKGYIARVALYLDSASEKMSKRGFLSTEEWTILTAWHRMYPPAEWECVRHGLVSAKQGENPYLSLPCNR